MRRIINPSLCYFSARRVASSLPRHPLYSPGAVGIRHACNISHLRLISTFSCRETRSRYVNTSAVNSKQMGETAEEKKEAPSEVEKKEEEKSKDKKKKKDKNEEGEKDKEGGEKKEKKKKNPEDKNDPTKLKAKLEKIETKMRDLALKKEEILNMIKAAESNASSGATVAEPPK